MSFLFPPTPPILTLIFLLNFSSQRKYFSIGIHPGLYCTTVSPWGIQNSTIQPHFKNLDFPARRFGCKTYDKENVSTWRFISVLLTLQFSFQYPRHFTERTRGLFNHTFGFGRDDFHWPAYPGSYTFEVFVLARP